MFSIDAAGETVFVDLPKSPVGLAVLILGLVAVGGLAAYGVYALADTFKEAAAKDPTLSVDLAKLNAQLEKGELPPAEELLSLLNRVTGQPTT